MITKNHVLMFKTSADSLFTVKDFTSATILYFKTWFAMQDLILLEKTGSSPKDHSERFRMLERYFPEDYKKLDMEFSTYRDTYSKITTEEDCARVKNVVEDEINNYLIDKEK